MSRRPKYRPGPPVRSLTAVVALLEQGQWFYWPNGKVLSPKWLGNMSLGTLASMCRGRGLRIALPNEEH